MDAYPSQAYGSASSRPSVPSPTTYWDVRDTLTPRRLTLAMWDQAYLLRHVPGGSFEDFGRVCRETVERGYNTVRLDPMLHVLDLERPDQELRFGKPAGDFMPWAHDRDVTGPVGRWLIDFIETLNATDGLHYTLSPWWFEPKGKKRWAGWPEPNHRPTTLIQAAERTVEFLSVWEKRFGFDRLVYVDLCNEYPYFLPDAVATFADRFGEAWSVRGTSFPDEVRERLSSEFGDALRLVQHAFPQLRFTVSIHADPRWLDLDLGLDCLDVHFYAENDRRWANRTGFAELIPELFASDRWHAEFSRRCTQTLASIGPMLRAKQRERLMLFARWARQHGVPLTTSESWSTWYYLDSPMLDWGWLLEWAEWTVEDATDAQMWGWTPHNYVQPQFANWDDVRWHRRLTNRFLRT